MPFVERLRGKGREVVIVMDNAAIHTCIETKKVFQEAGLKHVLWPIDSPDLNAIEHAWSYIRRAISKRRPFPRKSAESEAAWAEEWAQMPQKVVNAWIEAVPKRVAQVIEHRGRNDFHG